MRTRDLIDRNYTKQVTQEIVNAFRRGFAKINALPLAEITENRIIEILSREYDRSALKNADNMYNMSSDQYNAAIRKMSASIRKEQQNFSYTYNQVDRQMLNTLDTNNTLFIGKYFQNDLEPLIRKEMSKILTEQQSKKDTATAIAAMLKDQAGARAYNYSRMIVETNGTWARSIGNINAMEEAGITEYYYDVTLDNVTSEICQALAGKSFSIEKGMQARDSYLNMPTANYDTARAYLERTTPFIQATKDGNFKANNQIYTKDQLMSIPGVQMPPLHPNCRTEIFIK